MKKLTFYLILCSIFTSGLGSGQEATQKKQEQPKGPSFTTAVYTVLVDVIVTDRRDKHVNDLRQEEFELYENGVKQTIDTVEVQSESGVQSVTADRGTPAQPTPVPAASRLNMINFLLDYSTTEFENQKYVRDGAVKYIKEKIRPNDLVAIFSTGTGGLKALQPFTSDKELLTASLSKGDVSGSAYRNERALLNSQIGSERQAATADASLASSQAGGSGFVPVAAVAGAATGSAQASAMFAQRIEKSFVALRSFTDSMLARPILTAIKSIALAEKDIPGRKTLVLFSEGFVVPPNVEGVMRDAVDAANKANLAIYTVDTRGLRPKEASTSGELDSLNASQGRSRLTGSSGESLFDRARQVGSDQDESTLRFIANATGGFLIRNTNDFEIGLQRIDQDIRTYYILSYRPMNLEFDGKFRQIHVEVNRPGVKVRARNGYFATPPSDTLLTPDQRVLFTAARQKKSPLAIHMFAGADEFFQGEGASAAVVTVEVPTDALRFKENGTVLEDSLQIVGLVTDSGGGSVTAFGRPLPLQFTKPQMEVVRGGFVTHSESVALDPGKYTVEVLVHEPSTGNYGYYSKELALEFPREFKLSSLVLSRQVVKAAPEAKSDPLVTGEAKILPSASRQFRNGDRLIFYFDIYNAKSKDARSDVKVALALKKDGKPMAANLPSYNIAQPVKDGDFRIQVAKFLELAGLPNGVYTLIVQVKDNVSGATSSSESSFTLTN